MKAESSVSRLKMELQQLQVRRFLLAPTSPRSPQTGPFLVVRPNEGVYVPGGGGVSAFTKQQSEGSRVSGRHDDETKRSGSV